MVIVDVTCPHCSGEVSMPAAALLATIEVDGFGEPTGQLSWVCPHCERLVTADLAVADLLRLISAGVPLLEDGFGRLPGPDRCANTPVPRPLRESADGPPLTLDDVLTFHELLETSTWQEDLAEAVKRSS